MRLKDKIEQCLSVGISSEYINVQDESHKHAGHIGSRDEGETHFSVEIRSPEFRGLSRVKRHQIVYDILKDYMGKPIHALAIKADLPKN